ncbi:hypothetical protein PAHAL_6G020100 [Panicum hallii]|uniref:Uncharacterized protein n=1 Tax=Panicum hallii TaxID=206008 RepID=A0A2T8IEV8_9POAL|nr:hypothetical protein PAHAL_6G020100 [Panicum hallii]
MAKDDDRVRPWACEPCLLSGPHVPDPTASRDPGVDGISNSTPGRHLVCRPPLFVAASAASRGSPERRRARPPVWDDFQRPVTLRHDRERGEPPGVALPVTTAHQQPPARRPGATRRRRR